jgi:hypothetical protein
VRAGFRHRPHQRPATYREGFGNVLIEAAAMATPSVASRVTGCVDAVIDGVTGTLVPARSAPALVDAIARYLDDPELCARHGAAARRFALEEFAPERIWAGLFARYDAVLGEGRAKANARANRVPALDEASGRALKGSLAGPVTVGPASRRSTGDGWWHGGAVAGLAEDGAAYRADAE